MLDKIKKCLQEALTGAEIHLQSGDGKHIEAIIVAKQFVDKSRVEQHRLVMTPLADLFASSLHALQLKTYTPEEWRATQGEDHG